jgi:23S rRNA G2069 N7-methylase RlmK/C1962 C5-methylase RlmI
MTKVVINDSYGGFVLSAIAEELYEIKSNKEFNVYDIQRHDPILVEVVTKLKEKASTRFSKLIIQEIDSDRYYIDEYDGLETIITPDTIDWVIVDSLN